MSIGNMTKVPTTPAMAPLTSLVGKLFKGERSELQTTYPHRNQPLPGAWSLLSGQAHLFQVSSIGDLGRQFLVHGVNLAISFSTCDNGR